MSGEKNKLPGIIDPPVSTTDTQTLQQWMQQITEATRQGMGQIGDISNSYVKFNDLVDGGFLIPMQPPGGVEFDFTNGPIGGGYYQSGGSASFDLSPPSKVQNVTVSSLVGAMDIEWLPPEISYPHHYEVWRSTSTDRNDAVLIGTTSSLHYTDVNVVDEQTYHYWIRIAKTIGTHVIYGAYDSASGISGQSKSTVDNILDIVGEDMYIKTPGGNKNPFGYENIGSEEEPDWVVALRADVAIQGNLAISNLKSGELADTVALSVGQGSVTLDTRTDGSGQVVITGQGGTSENDYLILNQGRISSYVWDGSKHVPYKEIRRIERGVATAGHLVSVPAYFKAQPSIYLAPFIIPTYNPDYPTQGQQWRLSHSNVEPNPGEVGGWQFVPTAQLELTDGNSTQNYSDKTYNGSSNTHDAVISRRTSLKKCRVNTRFKSSRSTGTAGNFYNRKVTVSVWYRRYGTSTWLVGKTSSLNLSQFNEGRLTLDLTLPSVADYDLKVSYSAADSGGTFSTGTQYQYDTRTVSGSPSSVSVYGQLGYDESARTYISAPYIGSGWSIYKTAFSYRLSATGAASGSPNYYRGFVNHPVGTYYAPSSLDTTFSATRNYEVTWIGITASSNKLGYWARATMSQVSAVFYYRKTVGASTTPANSFYLDSIEYDQGGQLINPTNEEILVNWLAVGE